MTAPLAALREEWERIAERHSQVWNKRIEWDSAALSDADRIIRALVARAEAAEREVLELQDALTRWRIADRPALQARVAALEAVLKERPRCEAVRVLGGCAHTWCERVRALLATVAPHFGATP